MSYRSVNILFLLFLLTVSIWYCVQSIGFVSEAEDITVSAGFYPFILSSIIIVLSFIKLIQAVKEKKSEAMFEVRNLKYILMTIGVTSIYLVLWSLFRDYFYIFTFVYVFTLMTIYASQSVRFQKKMMMRNSLVSLFLIVVIYFIFDLTFSIQF